MLKKFLTLYLCFLSIYNVFGQNEALREYSKDTVLMGSAFVFTAVHQSRDSADKILKEAVHEVVRIENLISSWKEDSETYTLNQNAGIKPQMVGMELFLLIDRSKKVSDLTGGCFDISYASLDNVWSFDGSSIDSPSTESIRQSVEKVNYKNIVMAYHDQVVYLKEKGMKIGFGGIGKGYAADQVKKLMVSRGVKSGVVNAGGDLIAWGSRPDGKPWSIGIADPEQEKEILSWLDISNTAVVTSGSYEKYVIIDGVRYGHIINPKTGWPAKGLISVTVITGSAELADALATAVFVLGKDDGMALVNKLEAVECLMVTDEGKLISSKNVDLRYLYDKED